MSAKANQGSFREGSLVLYKHDRARVTSVGEKKITIVLPDGEIVRVRPKDIELLHPGPTGSIDQLAPQDGEMETAWELLSGRETTLRELTELAHGAYTPAAAWAAWQWVMDGLRFEGSPGRIRVRTPDEVAQETARREARAAERRAWGSFLERIREGDFAPEDGRYLVEVERLALGQTDQSRVLSELGRAATPENAHALLLEVGYWDHTVVPYPERLGLPTLPPSASLPSLPTEARTDLTHLPAFAIDDAGTADPDDAISLEMLAAGCRLWIHVADAAALVLPGSPADLEARARGACLYLPDGKISMLPRRAEQELAMGLEEVTPALSLRVDVGANGEIGDVAVVSSLVRVTRLTYSEAERRLSEPPLSHLHHLARDFCARRRDNGAIRIDLPEVDVYVDDGDVVIRSVEPLESRVLVREAMLIAGEATARFAAERGIPLPHAKQAAPDIDERPEDLAGMFALIRRMGRTEYSTVPGRHAGLGLESYVQVTSPLRRYLDLVVHQQLRAHLRGLPLFDGQELVERIGATEAVVGSMRHAERLAEAHWKLVYLMQHPDWQGEATLVDKWDRRGRFLIAELGLEHKMQVSGDWPLNMNTQLRVVDVDLPTLRAMFRLL